MHRVYFIIVVFVITAVLVGAVYVRSVNNRMYYKFSVCKAEQNRIRQQLGKAQIQVESLISPASVWRSIDRENQP